MVNNFNLLTNEESFETYFKDNIFIKNLQGIINEELGSDTQVIEFELEKLGDSKKMGE